MSDTISSSSEPASSSHALGRGKKSCPSCQAVVGARSRECKECGHSFEIKTRGSAKTAKAAAGQSAATQVADGSAEPARKVAEIDLLKVLNGKGYKIRRWIDEFSGEITSQEIDPRVKDLLEQTVYGDIPAKNCGGSVYCYQTSPSIQFAMDLDTLLGLLKLPTHC